MEEKDYKLLDQFLQGELDDQAKQAVETRLREDAAFAKAFSFRQEAHRFLQAKAREPKLRELLQQAGDLAFNAEDVPDAKIRKMKPWRWLVPLAAAIALLLVIWQPWIGKDLYQQYAVHAPLILTEKGQANTGAEAEQAFNAGNYVKAKASLRAYLAANPADNRARLALGIAALETNELSEARQLFDDLAEGNSVFVTAGKWYLALSDIKEGKQVQAKAKLNEVVMQNNEYSQRAKELLQHLE